MPRRACARGVTPDRAFEFGLKPHTVRGRSFLPEGPTLSIVPKVSIVPQSPKAPRPTVFEHAAACQLRSWMIERWAYPGLSKGNSSKIHFVTCRHPVSPKSEGPPAPAVLRGLGGAPPP